MSWRPTGSDGRAAVALVGAHGTLIAGNPREARGQRVDVGQVHRERVVDLLAELERGTGEVGAAMTSTSRNAVSKSRRMRVRTFCAFR